MSSHDPIDEKDPALDYHRIRPGKFEMACPTPFHDRGDLSKAYTPGVAKPCLLINDNPERAYEFTGKGNLVAVISDSTAVLGLGTLNAEGGLPVMEGKAILFRMLAGVNSIGICLKPEADPKTDPNGNVDEIVRIVKSLGPSFGGINLEDISAPRCFEIEKRLKKEMDIPVMHDDQHGTAIVTLAGLINALTIVDKDIADARIVFNGAGAAALACAKMYMAAGAKDVIMCDTNGLIYKGRPNGMSPYKDEIAKVTNRENIRGSLANAMKCADVFVGLSVANCVTRDMVASMAERPIVFACANPTPEIMPEDAIAAGAAVVTTGRSDYKNQINNVLGFPGIFAGALAVRAKEINEQMKMAAAHAIASLVSREDLKNGIIIVSPLDPRVAPLVASEVAKAAMESGVARIKRDPQDVKQDVLKRVAEAQRLSKVFDDARL